MSIERSSRIPNFYNLPISSRLELLAQSSGLEQEEVLALQGELGITPQIADHMIENVVGVFGLPLGIALNFIVNDREVLVPMAIEEPSVVAGASYMAKLARTHGGFKAEADPPEMIGQLQILDLEDPETAARIIQDHEPKILNWVDEIDPIIKGLGGGARQLEVRVLQETPKGSMLIVHLIYDTRDAMGANAVNTALERLAPLMEELTGGRVHLRILSNLADHRLARARCSIPEHALSTQSFSGKRVREGIIEAWAFAAADPYRAATQNKGIMNGIDAVLIATGNDWRAVEAGAHAYAARQGTYGSLSKWSTGEGGELIGELELPMAVGTVGGATRVHPTARASLALMGVRKAQELAEIVTSVGLAQNLAALRALATEGIQHGHMGLHARQVAISAGASGAQIQQIADRMVAEGEIRIDRAQQLLKTANQESLSKE